MMTSAVGRADISETLAKIRSIASQTKAFSPEAVTQAPKTQFNQVLSVAKDAVLDVSQAQNQAEVMKSAYLTGDPNVSMSQVMMSTMKSKVAFEGLLVVRNKLLDAYKEIMNMPV